MGDNRPHCTGYGNAPREHGALCGVSTARSPAVGKKPDWDSRDCFRNPWTCGKGGAEYSESVGGTTAADAWAPSARHARAGGGDPPETGGRGGGTPQAACTPSARHARTGGGQNQTNSQRRPPSRRARPSCAFWTRRWGETPKTCEGPPQTQDKVEGRGEDRKAREVKEEKGGSHLPH